MFSGVNMPLTLYREVVGSWRDVAVPTGRITPYGLAVRLLLPLIHSL
jgi:hypothetical protein